MLAVIIAIAGTIRPDMQIISSVEVATAISRCTRGRFVIATNGIVADSDIKTNTRNLPERSAQRPIQFMLKTVHRPPAK